MAYTTINKSTSFFNTKLYTGTGSSNAITGVGFQPDWTWIKNRDGTDDHKAFDAVRGVTKVLKPNTSGAETTDSNTLSAFGTDGFTVGSDGGVNGNGDDFVSWNWKAGTGQGSSNTDGSINTTYTSVNTTAGFSISQYTGTGSNATIGHGLGVVPKMIIVKRLSNSENWTVYNNSIGNTKYLNLDDDAAATTYNMWQNTTPTSSVFSITTHNRLNANGDDYIAYCFAEKTGYSKFGSYTGNGTTDNAFIYTGFKPTFFMTKRYSDTARWVIWDAVRDTLNPLGRLMYANENSAEGGYTEYLDFTSNGIKIRDGNSKWGADGSNYIYMAFGQTLVGSNNIPCTAR